MKSRELAPTLGLDGMPEILPQDLVPHLGKVMLIDVRRPDEFNGELGHIPGAKLMTQGPELEQFLAKLGREQEMVFVCRSGARSGRATLDSQALGFSQTVNLKGGMLRWNELSFPVERI